MKYSLVLSKSLNPKIKQKKLLGTLGQAQNITFFHQNIENSVVGMKEIAHNFGYKILLTNLHLKKKYLIYVFQVGDSESFKSRKKNKCTGE